MAKLWRLIPTGIYTAFENMAIDHILLEACHKGTGTNTLRLYRWSPSAVSIGRFQHINKEVDVDACFAHNIDVVRRISSGGTVYHDFEGELTYSLICRIDDVKISSDVVAAYEFLSTGLLKGLNRLGVPAKFSPGSERFCPNLFVNDRKISGNAQARRGKSILQHGTILRILDLQQMFSFLKIRETKATQEAIERAASKLTSLQQELGKAPPFGQIEEALLSGFSEALGARFIEEPLTSNEMQSAQHIARKWYATTEWTFKRGFKQ